MIREKKERRSEWFGLTALCYVMVGFVLLLCHKDESFPVWGWWTIFAISPLVIIALFAAQGLILEAGVSIFAAFLFLRERFPNFFKAIGGVIIGFYSGPHRFLESEARKTSEKAEKMCGTWWEEMDDGEPFRRRVKLYERCSYAIIVAQLFLTVSIIGWITAILGWHE